MVGWISAPSFLQSPPANAVEVLLLAFHEAEHRLANLLQVVVSRLNTFAHLTGDPQARAAIELAAEQIIMLARLQTALSPTDHTTPDRAVDEFSQLCSVLERLLLAPYGHVLSFSVPPPFDQYQLTNRSCIVMIAVTELVINAAKHAFPADGVGQVTVTLRQTKDCISCTVVDNGVGPVSMLKKQDRGGMSLVELIADAVGGSCHWAFSLNGTAAELRTPLIAARCGLDSKPLTPSA